MPPRLTILWSFQCEAGRVAGLNPPDVLEARQICRKRGFTNQKRPEIASGRKVEGQIRGGRTDVNVAASLATTRESAVFAVDFVPSGDHQMTSIFRRGFAVRLFAVAALVLIGVSAGSAQDAAAPAPAPALAPDTVLATVNGEPITEADLQLAITDLGAQFERLPAEQRRARAMSAIIEIRLLAAKAETDSLDKTPDFQRRIGFLRQRTLHSALVDTEVAGKITDEEIRTRYDQEIANTPPTNEVKARHILVKTKEEAVEIIKQLDGGARFEDIAKEKSSDPGSGANGGDLGWFGPGQMVPEFEKAAFALNVGEYTKEPVQSQFGWHVIKVEDKRAKQPPAFDQVKDQVRSILLREKYFALVKSVRDAAKVEITDPDLKAGVEQVEKAQ